MLQFSLSCELWYLFIGAIRVITWVKGAKSVELEDGTEVTSKEFKQLQKENQRLKEKLEILKAAAVLLGKH